MSRKSLSRQTAVDYPCTPETKSRKKPRKTDDLVALNFSTVDELNSIKSIKTTSKKTRNTNNVNLPQIDADVLPTRKILRARRTIKNDNINGKSAIIQRNFEKIHNIIDKAADEYFQLQTEIDDNDNNKENKTFNDNEDVTNHIEEQTAINNKKSLEKPFKKRSFINNFIKNNENQFNGDVILISNNLKKRHTIHVEKSQTSTQKKSLKSRRTIHNLNETFSIDEEKPTKKRRTYDLNVTVNNIQDLEILEQNLGESKLRKSSSFVFEDIPLIEELRPSTTDRRETFDVLPKSTVKQNSFDALENGSVIDEQNETFDIQSTSTVKQNSFDALKNGSVIDLCESASEVYMNNRLSTSIPPVNKRLNFSNITSRKKNDSIVQDDSVIVLDDTGIKETIHELSTNTRLEIGNQSTSKSKVSIFKTPFKKTIESKDSFFSSTPCIIGTSQLKTNTPITKLNASSNSANKSNLKRSRVKMPNFALLHQKAFSEMEDIVEYEKRKIERAKYLLSGKKPKSENSIMNNDESISKSIKFKKLLRFAPGFDEKQKPADFIPLPITPMPKNWRNINVEDGDSPAISFNGNLKQPTPKSKTVTPRKLIGVNNQFDAKEQTFKSKTATPRPKEVNNPFHVKKTTFKPTTATPRPKEVNNPFNVEKTTFKPTTATFKPKEIYNNPFDFKTNVHKPFNAKERTPKATVPVKGNVNRFGFKIVELAKPTRKDEIKAAVVNKTKFVKKGTEERRDLIKGVRSNRRFDLLMKMRNAH